MICQWRIEEEKVRSACSQAPASPYGRCELFRNQDPTAEWLAEEAGEIFTEENPTAPTTNETEAPYLEFYNVTEEPTEPPVAAPVESPSEPTSPTPFEFYNTTDVPIEAPVDAPVESPSETPYPIPPVDAPVESPSEPGSPSPAPIESTVTGAPPDIKCGDYTINFSRMCKSDDPCCGEKRSDTEFCWDSYDELGDAVQSACYHCCETPMFVGAAAPEKDNLPKTIQCSTVENPHRICKADSCCSNPRSESEHCVQQYALYTDDEFEQICHYCCTEPQDLGPSTTRRYLRSDEERAIDDSSLAGDMPVPVGAKVYNVHGRKYLVRQENFEPIEESEQEYFDKVYASHKRRSLATVHSENYEDIEWYPYEWLVKVGTEYYYRYEGAMMVPPCFETVHWRNMKDPVKVNKRQIDELNRLLAWRLDPDTCEKNTAGIVSDDGNRVNLNRDLQYTHKQHRAVFCECKDWPSKFEGDRAWCEDWKEDTNHDRFYTNMYNFDSGGQWLPTTAQ